MHSLHRLLPYYLDFVAIALAYPDPRLGCNTWHFDFIAWHGLDGWDMEWVDWMGQHGWTHEMIFL